MGYRAALAEAGVSAVSAEPASAPNCRMLIIPAALEITPELVGAIQRQLDSGGNTLLESGAAFACRDEFEAHRTMLRKELGIAIDSPVDLARGGCGRGRVPYVDYDWPFAVKVRDFSRVIPVYGSSRELIARAGGAPVALRRKVGRGSLIFLGSPLGPALWTGDTEARRWLGAAVLLRRSMTADLSPGTTAVPAVRTGGTPVPHWRS